MANFIFPTFQKLKLDVKNVHIDIFNQVRQDPTDY